MSIDPTPGFWRRLADRTVATGAFAFIEDPMTIVRTTTVILWTATLLAAAGVFGYVGAEQTAEAWTMVGLSAAYFSAWLVYVATGRFRPIVVIAIGASVAANLTLHLLLGGYANSGGLMLWMVATAVIVAVAVQWRFTVAFAAAMIVLAIVLAAVEPALREARGPVDPGVSGRNAAFVLVGSLVVVIPMLGFLLGRLGLERRRAEGLLLNVLPAEVAAELKETGRVAGRRFDEISVLFADIVGFTSMSTQMSPEEMVDRLNEVFTRFDAVTAVHDCEKIRTIGDNYMVAAGVPTPRPDHAHALARVALEMQAYAAESPFRFRIGINSGPAVAGVIGTSKFQYDVWGDTVNTASRMESHGEPGRIQLGPATWELIREEFECTHRGRLEIKGRGEMDTWFLESERPRTAD